VAYGLEFRRDMYPDWRRASGILPGRRPGGIRGLRADRRRVPIPVGTMQVTFDFGRQADRGIACRPCRPLRAFQRLRRRHCWQANGPVNDFAPEFALRGTLSNGFRAPTLAEEYFSSTNVGPAYTYIQMPPDGPGAKYWPRQSATEKSTNLSVGFVLRPSSGHEPRPSTFTVSDSIIVSSIAAPCMAP